MSVSLKDQLSCAQEACKVATERRSPKAVVWAAIARTLERQLMLEAVSDEIKGAETRQVEVER